MALKELFAFSAKMAALAVMIPVALAQATGPISSGDTTISASAAGGSFLPVFSQEGDYVAFLSHANNLVANDDFRRTLDVFLFHVPSGTNELISVSTNGHGGGDADSGHVSVSRYATTIAFISRSSNFTTNDTNNAVDTFIRSRLGTSGSVTRLISTDRFGRGLTAPPFSGARPRSSHPVIGTSVVPGVVFQTFATNLVPIIDTNNATDIFARDSESGAFALISVAHSGATTGDRSSHSPQVAGDFVGFISTATNLHAFPSPAIATNRNRGGDIYVRSEGVTHWASPNTRDFLRSPGSGAFPPSYSCFNFAISGNGAVVYEAEAGPGWPTALLYCARGAPSPTLISMSPDPVGQPGISWYGDVIFSSRSNVYIWNSVSGSNILVSVNTNGLPANGPSHSPIINRFGSYAAFVSSATDLVTNALGGGFQIYVRILPDGPTRLVTVNTNGVGSLGDFEHSNVVLPPEGNLRVAFDSPAPDLVAGDFNGASDVFVRDISRNQTTLVSRRLETLPARTSTLMSGVAPNSISADGRVVVFTSFDNPLVPDDTNIWQDVFVRDLISGELQRVSGKSTPSVEQAAIEPVVSASGSHAVYTIAFGPFQSGGEERRVFWYSMLTRSNVLISTSTRARPLVQSNPISDRTSISSNGNLVVFQSIESARTFNTNFFEGNSAPDIFARDMTTGETKLISVDYTGTSSGNGASSNAVLSPNGRWVVFQSAAGNIVNVPADGSAGGLPPGYLYARDLLSNTSRVASVGHNSLGSNIAVAVLGPAVFSGDSEWIGYVVTNNEVYIRNLLNGNTRAVCDSCAQPRLNHNAVFVAYETLSNNGPAQIWVKNTVTGLAKLISANISGLPGNGTSSSPQISPDGRFVVFQSLASDLVVDDTNNASDIFVGDRVLGSVVLLTINRTGSASGNGSSSKPVLSADGRTVVFQSLAGDLIAGDYNDRRDVFYATLSLPDSDADGIDDDFEITYFGNLDRNGSGDMDNDGQTDLEEFLAGTNPTSGTSILRVITLNVTGADSKQLIWSAVPGRTYLVQYKDDLKDPWSTLGGTIRATSTTATKSDSALVPHRYYRVLLAE